MATASIYCEAFDDYACKFYDDTSHATKVYQLLTKRPECTYAALHLHSDWPRKVTLQSAWSPVAWGTPIH